MSENEFNESIELEGIEFEEPIVEEKQKKPKDLWTFFIIDTILIVLFILSATQTICYSYACIIGIIGVPILLGISVIISIILWFNKRKQKLNHHK